MESLINDVFKCLETLDDGTLETDGQWTVAIKKALIDIAGKHGLMANCSSIGGQYRENHINLEWLYDIILYTVKEDDIFDEVYLAGEIEWHYDKGELENDFSKLLLVGAKMRLMVYQVYDEKYYDELRNRFINIIEKSKSCLSDDVYLFAVYYHPIKNFKFEKYIKK